MEVSHALLLTGSAKPVEARKQSLGSTAIQPQASFLAEVAEVTKQQVIPELTSNTKLPRDGDKVGTGKALCQTV